MWDMKKKWLLLSIGFIFTMSLSAQQKDPYDYNSEFVWGINKNTAGGWIGGFVFKYAHKLNDRMLESYGLELMNVKHPKEHRSNNSGSFFIYGKLNYLYAVRLQYGREFILFKKDSEQGVEIKLAGALGPSLGVVAPYYVNYAAPNGSLFFTESVRHDPYTQNFQQVFGPGRLFQGLGDASIVPGANIKAAVNFEMGALKTHVTGFELGFLLDAYTQEVELMAETDHRSIFPTAFITLYYGSRK